MFSYGNVLFRFVSTEEFQLFLDSFFNPANEAGLEECFGDPRVTPAFNSLFQDTGIHMEGMTFRERLGALRGQYQNQELLPETRNWLLVLHHHLQGLQLERRDGAIIAFVTPENSPSRGGTGGQGAV